MVTNDATDSSAFAPGPGIDGATRSAPQAVARRAFLAEGLDGTEVFAFGREAIVSSLDRARGIGADPIRSR